MSSFEANGSVPYSFGGETGTFTNASVFVTASTSSNLCSGVLLTTSRFTPSSGEDNVTVPITPGFVLPTGDEIGTLAAGDSAEVTLYGYTVPASEASSADPGRLRAPLHLPRA